MATASEQKRARLRIWQSLCEWVSATMDDEHPLLTYFKFVAVRDYAAQLIDEYPGSGVTAEQVALEFYFGERSPVRKRASRSQLH